MRSIAAIGLLGVFAAACSENPTRIEFAEGDMLQIRPAFVRVIAGDTIHATIHSFDDDGDPVFAPDVEWSSLDPSLASVDENGVVTTTGAGWARIVATAPEGAADTSVLAIGLRLRSVSAGDDLVCGTDHSGAAWCWGSDWEDYGQFGTGALGTHRTPAAVAGGLSFDAIEPGDNVACGIADMAVYCWGWKRSGLVGVTEPCGNLYQGIGRCVSPMRIDVDAEVQFESVAAGMSLTGGATCASGPSGVWCSGVATDGMLGPAPGCSPSCYAPVLVSDELTGKVVVGQVHACALDASGAAWCWGRNDDGQLGAEAPETCSGVYPCARTPVRVDYAGSFVDISAGDRFTCGLTDAGGAICWGSYDRFGSEAAPMQPAPVGGGIALASIDAGGGHVCGLVDGDAYCWGDEAYSGALGEPLADYDTDPVLVPRLVASPVKFDDVAAGAGVSCGVAVEGGVWCWGGGWSLGQTSAVALRPHPLPAAPPGDMPMDLPANMTPR